LQVARRDQVHRHPALAQADVGVRRGARQQRVVDGLAGGVGRVRDAPHRVPAFARQVQAQRAVRVGRKRHPGVDQPLHGARAVLGDVAGRVFVHQAGAGFLRVAHVRFDAVVAAQHADDAALRPGGGAFLEFALGQHDHRRSRASSRATASPPRPAPTTTTGPRRVVGQGIRSSVVLCEFPADSTERPLRGRMHAARRQPIIFGYQEACRMNRPSDTSIPPRLVQPRKAEGKSARPARKT
jgi:hypothetical protein